MQGDAVGVYQCSSYFGPPNIDAHDKWQGVMLFAQDHLQPHHSSKEYIFHNSAQVGKHPWIDGGIGDQCMHN